MRQYVLSKIKMYPGDKKIFELLSREGVFEIVTQYDRENLVRFDSYRVA